MTLPQVHPEEKRFFELGERAFYFCGAPMDFSCASCYGEVSQRIRLSIRHGFGNLCRCDAATDAATQVATAERDLYDLPALGNASLLPMTDCRAQLKPTFFCEASVNLGLGSMHGQLLHVVGENLLLAAGVRPGTSAAHA